METDTKMALLRREADDLSNSSTKAKPDYFTYLISDIRPPATGTYLADNELVERGRHTSNPNQPKSIAYHLLGHIYKIDGITALQRQLYSDTYLTKCSDARGATIDKMRGILAAIKTTALQQILEQTQCPKCHGMIGKKGGKHQHMPTKKLHELWNMLAYSFEGELSLKIPLWDDILESNADLISLLGS